MNHIIRVKDLQVCRAGRTICSVPELNIQRGQRVGVLGANGSGKTTLLRVLAGMENDYAGQCLVDPCPRQRVFVHQAPFLFRGTVLFNTTYGMAARGLPRNQRIAHAQDWLAKLGVAHLAHRQCRNLSGGEQRRVALARALAIDPEVLLLDEPLSDLDGPGAQRVARAIRENTRPTVLIASPIPLPSELVDRTYTVVTPP